MSSTNGSEHIFRAEAVAAIDAVDRLDEAITIVSARSALALLALLVLITAALLWAVFGTIPVTVAGRGAFVAGAGTAHVSAADDGTIESVDVAVGDSVRRGQAIAKERTANGQTITLRAPRSGTVIEIPAPANVFVHRGDLVTSIAPAGQKLHAIVFVPVNSDRHVERGMAASVIPADASNFSGRTVGAEVASVAPYPASAERIRNALQDDALAAQFSPAVPMREVDLELLGAKAPPAAGTPCTATIQVRERHPIEIIFSRSQ